MTVGVLRRMEASVFALEPRLVVLLIGVNDLSRGYSPETVTYFYGHYIFMRKTAGTKECLP